MADPKQLEILKKGVKEWNDWREANPDVELDLSDADLKEADLRNANLRKANLIEADLTGVDLHEADLRKANLYGATLRVTDLTGVNLIKANLNEAKAGIAILRGAVLMEADLRRAELIGADLSGAKLISADLRGADLINADLVGANLSSANLCFANLIEAKLAEARFTGARCRGTNFDYCDLSKTIDLEKVNHNGPSTIGVGTLRLSRSKIPESFMRGCGLSDWEIESVKLYNPDLTNDEVIEIQTKIFELQKRQAVQLSNLFISYSHVDSAFVDKLETHLIKNGIRFWRDVHHATAGRLEKVIDRAMRLNSTVLLVLSKDSIQSDWVEHEVKSARKLEKELGSDVLCPVALDDEWKRPNSWSQVLVDQVKKYNILDFSQWNDDSKFKAMFGRLIKGLNLFYKN